ncbi:MAG: type IV secretory system conjugative DNA transfer family protein [Clostridia bacterium]|nr:type IV secretory system conjugative DNA transfer family protein [Clostridia bacterium]
MRQNRWNEPYEIKNLLSKNGTGPILYVEGKEKYTYSHEGHTLILGISGTGKSRRGTIPLTYSAIQNKESAIVFDPKGEITKYTIESAKKTHDVHVIDFRFPAKSEGYNPLEYPYMLSKSEDKYLNNISEMAFSQVVNNIVANDYCDPYWTNIGKATNKGILSLIRKVDIPETINICFLSCLLAYPDVNHVSQFFNSIQRVMNLDKLSGYNPLNALTNASVKTIGNIYSTIMADYDKIVSDKNLVYMMENADFKIADIDVSRPTIIYVIVPDYNTVYSNMAGLLISQLSSHLLYLADNKYNGILPIRYHFIIDELGNVAQSIPNLPQLMTAGRSRNIRMHLVLQALSQLTKAYGSNATTIISNADIIVTYRINDYETMRNLSLKCGSYCTRDMEGRPMETDLISPTDIGALALGQALVLISGRYKFVANIPDFTRLYDQSFSYSELPECYYPNSIAKSKCDEDKILCSFLFKLYDIKLEEVYMEDGDENLNEIVFWAYDKRFSTWDIKLVVAHLLIDCLATSKISNDTFCLTETNLNRLKSLWKRIEYDNRSYLYS